MKDDNLDLAEIRDALKELYELCRDDNFGKGWKRGQQAMRNAEIALGYIPRKSPYSWDKRGEPTP